MGKKSENTKTPALLQSTEKLLVALRAVIKVSIQLCLDHFQTKSQFQNNLEAFIRLKTTNKHIGAGKIFSESMNTQTCS